MTTIVPINIDIHRINSNLLTHVPKGGSIHQPLDGRQLEDSPRSSHEAYPRGEPPINPHVESFGWPTPNPHMFILSCYPPLTLQHVPKPTTKLPFKKLQYLTYVKNTNLNVYIRVFKKDINANGENLEAGIINLVGFALKNSMYEWGGNFVQGHPNCT
jgi:hypothetical protein